MDEGTENAKQSVAEAEPATATEDAEELKKDIGSLDSDEADAVYIEDGEEMFGEQLPSDFSEEEPTQVAGAGSETVLEEGVVEEEESDEDFSPQQAEENRIEIPNLNDFMQSLTELFEEQPKKRAHILAPKKKHVVVGEEMGEEEAVPEIDEERPEAYDSTEDLEKKEKLSDEEIFMLLEEVEYKPKVEYKKRREPREPFDILKASGIKDLLDGIIDELVAKSETVSPEAVLQIKLDRSKLSRAFKINISELRDENKKRNWLLKKVIEYYRKKKYLRALAEDNPDTLHHNLKRYREVLATLDKAMAREDVSKLQLQRRIDELKDTEEELTEEADKKLEELNKQIKEIALSSVSGKSGQSLSEKAIDAIISKMNFLRSEISRLRLTFIKAQHKIALLQNEARRLEDIGEGLKMIDYDSLRAETQELEDKLEERNTELSKIRDRCTTDAHLLCHIREKQFMLNCIIVKQNNTLDALKEELNRSRIYLSALKLERDRTRKKHQDMSYQCGLLDKTNLLYDYDVTVAKIHQTEASVEKLKKSKIYYLEQLEIISKQLDRPLE